MSILRKFILCPLGYHQYDVSKRETHTIEPACSVFSGNKLYIFKEYTIPSEYSCKYCGAIQPRWQDAFKQIKEHGK